MPMVRALWNVPSPLMSDMTLMTELLSSGLRYVYTRYRWEKSFSMKTKKNRYDGLGVVGTLAFFSYIFFSAMARLLSYRYGISFGKNGAGGVSFFFLLSFLSFLREHSWRCFLICTTTKTNQDPFFSSHSAKSAFLLFSRAWVRQIPWSKSFLSRDITGHERGWVASYAGKRRLAWGAYDTKSAALF